MREEVLLLRYAKYGLSFVNIAGNKDEERMFFISNFFKF
jgi:hypothetical protein